MTLGLGKPSSPISLSWLDALPAGARDLMTFMVAQPAVAQALGGMPALNIRAKGAPAGTAPLLPHASLIAIDPDDPDRIRDALHAADAACQCILVHDVLQRIEDYRSFLAACFHKLAVGGQLIVVVPHQFLLERKLQVPSRVSPTHRRFYTPGSLLTEIEEALDPSEFRLRFLADNDLGYDYATRLDRMPSGCHDIVLCLERMARPVWSDQLANAERHATTSKGSMELPPVDAAAPVYRVIMPDHGAIARILVLKVDHRGDFLMATRAFRILRAAFPAASITLVCGPWNRAEAEALDIFDRVLGFEFFAEDASAGVRSVDMDEAAARLQALLGDASYDLAVDFRVYDDTRRLLRSVKARHRAGFDPHDRFPWLSVRLNVPAATQMGRPTHLLVPASEFQTREGERTAADIFFARGRRKGGDHLAWGPYISLRQGRYLVELLIELLPGARGKPFELLYDIVSDGATKLLGRGRFVVARGHHPQVALEADEDLAYLEWRIMAERSKRLPGFRFAGLAFTRQVSSLAVHQSEAMALLAHLLPIRLEAAFNTSETA